MALHRAGMMPSAARAKRPLSAHPRKRVIELNRSFNALGSDTGHGRPMRPLLNEMPWDHRMSGQCLRGTVAAGHSIETELSAPTPALILRTAAA